MKLFRFINFCIIFLLLQLLIFYFNTDIATASDSINDNSLYNFTIDNEEMVTKMLKEKGVIDANINNLEAHKLFEEYTRTSKQNQCDISKITSKEKHALKSIGNKYRYPEYIFNLIKKYTDNIVKDNVLVILVDFPDLKFNSLKNSDTLFYYPTYNNKHYEELLFSNNTYKGPNGEDFISMRQYYNIQSNNTYDIDGQVVGPYTTEKNASYYGADDLVNNRRDVNTKELVKEALTNLAQDPSVNLSNFDHKSLPDTDLYQNQPDKILDHIIIIHAGLGQEYGGGSLNTDAISSHSSKVYENDGISPFHIPNTEYSAYKYIIGPEDGTVGVFSHEYAHDLGYHDEYDTKFNNGDPISWWSPMSKGEWAGLIPGTQPVGFSPYAKEFFQGKYGNGWFNPKIISSYELTNNPKSIVLDQASIKGTNESIIKLNLPNKITKINTPSSGKYEYWSGSENNLNSSMKTNVNLKNFTDAQLTFKTWYSIEDNYDYASIKIKCEGEDTWSTIPGNITKTNSTISNSITGKSNGWVDAVFDLSKYCGRNIQISFNYTTDSSTFKDGFYVDDIKIEGDSKLILFDDCEKKCKFKLNNFVKSDGNKSSEHYYLLEWRNNSGIDIGLSNIKSITDKIQYDSGLLIWYIDKSYDNNWSGSSEYDGHPGYGYIGVIDAEQSPIVFNIEGNVPAPADLQMHDAAFSLNKPSTINIKIPNTSIEVHNTALEIHSIFNDYYNYYNENTPNSGRILTPYGINIEVASQDATNSFATIKLSKK